LGVDRNGKFIIEDIMDLYHTFISGQVGGGKSTILNTMIQSAMYLCNNVSFILVDFKLVGFGIYYKFNNCYCVEDYNDFKNTLVWLKDEMMKRYRKFRDLGIEDIWQYHDLGKKMNYILLVIDEMSNIKLSGNAKKKDDDINIEDTLINILNMSRGAGIIIIAATQNPYAVEIKSNARNKFITNISARIAKRRVQEMTGVMGTENLQKGEFKMVSTKIKDLEFKSFLVKKDGKNNLVYDELEKLYKNGGASLDENFN
jgi:DNA segregation ATPase FtsK/SpoIIIE-like protein